MSSSNNSRPSGNGSNSTPSSVAAKAGSYLLSFRQNNSSNQKKTQVFVCEYCQHEHLTQDKATECEINCCKKPRANETFQSGLSSDEDMDIIFECEVCGEAFPSEAEAELCEAQCHAQQQSLKESMASDPNKKPNSPVENAAVIAGTDNNKSNDYDDDDSSSSDEDDVLDLNGIRSLAQPVEVMGSSQPLMGLNAGFTQTTGELPFSLDEDDPIFRQQQTTEVLNRESLNMEPASVNVERNEDDRDSRDGESVTCERMGIDDNGQVTTGNAPEKTPNTEETNQESQVTKSTIKPKNHANQAGNSIVVCDEKDKSIDSRQKESQWSSMFERLNQFQTEFGHLYVKEEDKPELFAWMEEQRRTLGKKLLDGQKIENDVEITRVVKLESIAFPWTDGLLSSDWNSMYDELVKFHDEAGHTNVPAGLIRLCNWVKFQRNYLSERRKNDCCNADDLEAIARLNDLGFQWPPISPKPLSDDSRKSAEDSWETYFGLLTEYCKRNGHCRVPENYNAALHYWYRSQRRTLVSKLRNGVATATELARCRRFKHIEGFFPDDLLSQLSTTFSASLPADTTDQTVSLKDDNDFQDSKSQEGTVQDQPSEGHKLPIAHSLKIRQPGDDAIEAVGSRLCECERERDDSSVFELPLESEEDEIPRDYPETFRHSWLLEKQVMRKIKLDILKQQEAEFMQKCHFDICRQEEEDIMSMIREDIELSVAQKAAEIQERDRLRDSGVLEASFFDKGLEKTEILLPAISTLPLQMPDAEDPWRESIEKGAVDESEAFQFAKIIPRSFRGYTFFDSEADPTRLQKSIEAFCLVHVLNIEGDPNSCVIAIICDQWDADCCLDQLNAWLKRRRMHVMARILSEKGRQIEVVWNTAKQATLGITVVTNSWERGKLLMLPRASGQVMEPLREGMKDGCILLEAVDGIEMDSTRAFKSHITPRVKAGLTIMLSCKVFDSGLMQDDIEEDQVTHIAEEEDENATMDTADDESCVDLCSDQSRDDTNDHETAADVASSKNAKLSGDKQHSPQEKHVSSTVSYKHFKRKYKPLVELEFSGAGIHVNKAISHMWGNHKRLLGSTCDEFCSCPYEVHELCKDMVKDILKKNPSWHNPLALRAGDIPIGFVSFFCPKMLPNVKEEFPQANPCEHLDLLCRMWRKHESNMAFGSKCSQDCDCETAWETVFLKVGRKRRGSKTSSSAGEGSANSKSTGEGKHQGDRPSASYKRRADEPMGREHSKLIRKERRTEYTVAFKTADPMGFYFVNEQRNDGQYCVVNSVFPLGQDERIRRGTTVLAVDKKNGGRTSIESYEMLRKLYYRHKSAGEDIQVVFINLQDDDDLKILNADPKALRGDKQVDTDVWTKSGKWKGRSNLGWPGGAYLLRRQPRPNRIVPNKVIEAEAQRNSLSIGLAVSKASLMPMAAESKEVWRRVTIPRQLISKQPRSIIAGATGHSDRPRRFKFSSAANEIRQFDVDWPASDFLVKTKLPQPTSSRQREANIVPGKVDSRPSLASIHETKKRSRSAIEAAPSNHSGQIRNQGNPDFPGASKTKIAQSPSELAKLLSQAVKSGTFLGLLQLLEDGAALEMQSSKPIRSFLEIVKPEKEKGNSDFVLKDKILKCWFTTIEIASSAAALKHINRLFITAQKVTILDPSTIKLEAGEDLAVSWLASARNRSKKDCSRSMSFPKRPEYLFPAIDQTKPFEFTWNGDMESDSQLEVSIFAENKFTGEKRHLGSGSKRIRDIFKRSERSQIQIYISCGPNSGVVVAELIVTDFRLSEQDKFHKILRDKRSDLCRGLNKTVLDTIARFNTEIEPHWGKEAYMSVEVPAHGTNLLEISIKLADEKSVKRLLKMGAKVTKKTLDFARAEKSSPLEGCGLHLESIFELLKAHYQSKEGTTAPAPASFTSSSQSKRDGEEADIVADAQFSRVGPDWLFSLDKMIHNKFKKRCRNVEQDGYCRFGSTCYYGHVCQPDVLKSSSLFPPREFKEHQVEVRTVNSPLGEEWFTAGYREGNSFYYSWKKKGIKHKPTGIYWYKKRETAVQAVKSLVVGEDETPASAQLPDPDFTLL